MSFELPDTRHPAILEHIKRQQRLAFPGRAMLWPGPHSQDIWAWALEELLCRRVEVLKDSHGRL
jgi:hypothetical protein